MRLGSIELKGVIGQGGSGVVYRGQKAGGEGELAVKVLSDEFAHTREAVESLLGEVRAATSLGHPNIIATPDLGALDDGTVYLAMEHLEGESLRDRLARVQRLPLFEAINIMRQVAHGLGAAHAAGLAHGDLKPANLFLCRRKGRRRIVRRSKAAGMRLVVEPEASFDLVKLLDFGMAKFLDLTLVAQVRSGAGVGTAHYLSPEQAQGLPPSPRSDIYSLGAIFYEMVSGTVPFSGDTLADILKGHASAFVTPPSRRAPKAGIDARIDAIILRCLMKNPAQRFAGTLALTEALDGCVTDCAFLRDAHRLPGIVESGIDLSEGLREARQDPARAREGTAAAAVKAKPVTSANEAVTPRPAPAATRARSTPTPAAAPPARDPAATVVTPAPGARSTSVPREIPPAETPPAETPPAEALARGPSPTDPADQRGGGAATAGEHPEGVGFDRGHDWNDVLDESSHWANRRGSRMAAVMGVLLLAGIGFAVWTTRPSASRATKGFVLPAAPPSPTPAVAIGAAPPPAVPAAPPALSHPAPTASAPSASPAVVLPPAAAAATGPAPVSPRPSVAPVAPPAPAGAPAKPAEAAAVVSAPAPEIPVAPAPAAVAAKPRTAAPVAKARSASRGPSKAPVAKLRVAKAALARRPTGTSAETESAPVAEPAISNEAVPTSPPAAAAPTPSPESKPTPEPEAAPASAGDLVQEAQRAWLRGHYAVAIDQARAALAAEPKPAQAAQAYEIIGTAACAIGDGTTAREAGAHLTESRREALKSSCEKHGVSLE